MRDESSPLPGDSWQWFSVGGQRVRLLRDGREAYPAMLEAIAEAEREVLLEMYWLGSDEIGRRFVDALSERARAGVLVRVIFDAIGSAPVDRELFAGLSAAGGDVRIYHRLRHIWHRQWLPRLLVRDHRKVLVCDGAVGFTGGLNIGLAWAPREEGGEGFRDDMAEVRGSAALELRATFYDTWRRVIRLKERRNPEKMPVDMVSLRREPTSDVWVMATRQRASRRALHRAYLLWIRRAERSIDIVNAYFVPDWAIRRALLAAVTRGVIVRLLVPAHGDVSIVQLAMEATLERLVKKGLRVYAYTGSVLHSKTAVFDEQNATIGSCNLDYRSFRYNLEANLAVRDEAFARHVRQRFELDLAMSDEWTYEVLRARGVLRRLLGELARLIAKLL